VYSGQLESDIPPIQISEKMDQKLHEKRPENEPFQDVNTNTETLNSPEQALKSISPEIITQYPEKAENEPFQDVSTNTETLNSPEQALKSISPEIITQYPEKAENAPFQDVNTNTETLNSPEQALKSISPAIITQYPEKAENAPFQDVNTNTEILNSPEQALKSISPAIITQYPKKAENEPFQDVNTNTETLNSPEQALKSISPEIITKYYLLQEEEDFSHWLTRTAPKDHHLQIPLYQKLESASSDFLPIKEKINHVMTEKIKNPKLLQPLTPEQVQTLLQDVISLDVVMDYSVNSDSDQSFAEWLLQNESYDSKTKKAKKTCQRLQEILSPQEWLQITSWMNQRPAQFTQKDVQNALIKSLTPELLRNYMNDHRPELSLAQYLESPSIEGSKAYKALTDKNSRLFAMTGSALKTFQKNLNNRPWDQASREVKIESSDFITKIIDSLIADYFLLRHDGNTTLHRWFQYNTLSGAAKKINEAYNKLSSNAQKLVIPELKRAIQEIPQTKIAALKKIKDQLQNAEGPFKNIMKIYREQKQYPALTEFIQKYQFTRTTRSTAQAEKELTELRRQYQGALMLS
jgi:hypothetical protein